jgi:NhaP-type Na+/H+ or K+/H+ antiporter
VLTLIGIYILLLFAYGLVSRRLERTIVTGPMVFTVAGIVVAMSLPDLAGVDLGIKPVTLFGEVTLALVLFVDATRIPAHILLHASLPRWLLGIGMPLTIVAGTVAGVLLFPSLTLWEAAILATILAPTDAGLGQVVFGNPLVPARIRRALNVESGLNDGISLPFLMLFVALAVADPGLGRLAWIGYTAQKIGFGVLLGLVCGWGGGWLLHQAEEREWMTETFGQLGLLSLGLLAWGVAEAVGGNGFIAAFVGGILVKRSFGSATERMVEFSEAWGQLLSYAVFFMFGLLAAPDLGRLNAVIVLYALLSLTAVRVLPVAIALAPARLARATVLFMGWFGPRGLASVVLGLIFIKQKTHLPGQEVVLLATVATVLASVFAHGISALPGVKWYARQVEALDGDAPELVEADEAAA